MLIITLRVDETLTIGDDVMVSCTGISKGGQELIGGQVKIGIDAPDHVIVNRGRSLTGRQPRPRRVP